MLLVKLQKLQSFVLRKAFVKRHHAATGGHRKTGQISVGPIALLK
jgi:hypothetical protein